MMRRIAVVGDMLSNGGEVCSYEGPQFLIHGAFLENVLKSLPGKKDIVPIILRREGNRHPRK
jgi:hypothetical protein